MPSYDNYCHLLHDGNFVTHHVDDFVPPVDSYIYRWGVNLTERKNIEQGGDIVVKPDGDILVVPSVFPNDGTP